MTLPTPAQIYLPPWKTLSIENSVQITDFESYNSSVCLFGLVELHTIDVSPYIQPIWIPLQSLSTLRQITRSCPPLFLHLKLSVFFCYPQTKQNHYSQYIVIYIVILSQGNLKFPTFPSFQKLATISCSYCCFCFYYSSYQQFK